VQHDVTKIFLLVSSFGLSWFFSPGFSSVDLGICLTPISTWVWSGPYLNRQPPQSPNCFDGFGWLLSTVGGFPFFLRPCFLTDAGAVFYLTISFLFFCFSSGSFLILAEPLFSEFFFLRCLRPVHAVFRFLLYRKSVGPQPNWAVRTPLGIPGFLKPPAFCRL